MTGNDIVDRVVYACGILRTSIVAGVNPANDYNFHEIFNQWAEAAEIHLFQPHQTSLIDTELSCLQKERLSILHEIIIIKESERKDTSAAVLAVNTFLSDFQKFVDRLDSNILNAKISWKNGSKVVNDSF